MEMWIANGSEVAWLIDPQRKAVEIYRPGDYSEVFHDPSVGAGNRVGGESLGIDVALARS
jgi:Uma2 family endonuclease